MISIQEARKVLGPLYEGLDDDQIQNLIVLLYSVCRIGEKQLIEEGK